MYPTQGIKKGSKGDGRKFTIVTERKTARNILLAGYSNLNLTVVLVTAAAANAMAEMVVGARALAVQAL